MVFINEWFPNPPGNDGRGEFVELWNSNTTPANLNGWVLSDGKKEIPLSGYSVPPEGYLVLRKTETKLTLKNTDGGLSLYGPNGLLIDGAAFAGSAPEGKSFSRVDYGTGDTQHFSFADPSPGERNNVVIPEIKSLEYPVNVPLNPAFGFMEAAGLAVGVAIFLTIFLFYGIKKSENLSELLFARDGEAW